MPQTASARRVLWLLGALALLAPGAAHSTTWTVNAIPGDNVDRVGAVVEQAASGDTIQIGPGLYYEHIPLGAKALVLIGTAGASQTLLDGSRAIAGREGSVLYTTGGVLGELVLEGLTFQNGTGSSSCPGTLHPAGGGVFLCQRSWAGPRIEIRSCAFVANALDPDGLFASGAALYIFGENIVEVADSEFRGNGCEWGAVLHLDGATSGTVRRCLFEANSCPNGAMVEMELLGPARVEDCTFRQEGIYYRMGAFLTALENHLLRNRFEETVYPGQTSQVFLDTWAITEPPGPYQTAELIENVFWTPGEPNNAGDGTLVLRFWDSDVWLTRNTFVRASFNLEYMGGRLDAEGNLFFESALSGPHDGGILRCNDSWPDSLPALPGFEYESNLHADPLFCDEPAGELTIARESPCAAAHSPPGCGRIGALDPACAIDATVPATWGRIKAGFR